MKTKFFVLVAITLIICSIFCYCSIHAATHNCPWCQGKLVYGEKITQAGAIYYRYYCEKNIFHVVNLLNKLN